MVQSRGKPEAVRKECGNRGYDHVRFLTDEPLGDALSLFLHSREEAGRAAAAGREV